MTATEMRRQIVETFYEVVTGDEDWETRCHAATVVLHALSDIEEARRETDDETPITAMGKTP